MRKAVAVVVVLVIVAFCVRAQTGVQGKSAGGTKEAAVQIQTKFSCPMHADVKADKGGKCPKCGMEMTRAAVKSSCCAEGTLKKGESRTKECRNGGCKNEGGNGCCGAGAAGPKK
jgi:hypothetical protein